MIMTLANYHPERPRQITLPDVCETCESCQRPGQVGHHTYLAVYPGLTDGTALWFCSEACFKMSPVPTMEGVKR